MLGRTWHLRQEGTEFFLILEAMAWDEEDNWIKRSE